MPATAAPPPDLTRAQLLARAIWTVAALVVLANAAVTLGGVGDPSGWLTNGWTVAGVFALCAATAGARSLANRQHRAAWLALAVGLALYALGQVGRLLGFENDENSVSVPTLLWLALGPAGVLAMVLRLRADGTPIRRDLWLDGVIGGLAVSATGVHVIYELIAYADDHTHAIPFALAYSFNDLLAVGFGVGLAALFGWRPPPSFVALIAGFAVLCVQDGLYLDAALHGEYSPQLDTAWMASMLAIAAAAAWPRPTPMRIRPLEPRAVIAAPLAFGVLAVGGATLSGLSGHGGGLPVVLTSAALLAVVARCALAFRANVEVIATLERAERHLEEAQRYAQVGSWEWDGETSMLTWSAEMGRLHGRPGLSTLPDAEAMELIHPEDRERVTAAFVEAWETTEPVSVEYRVAHDGRILLCQGVGDVVDGALVRMFGTCQDVTDRFARSEAERANQAKSRFLSRMSHELRTPLNAIIGFSQLLAASDLSERQRGNTEHILGAGRHLLDLVDEVLDIARIEAGELSLALKPIEVAPVVREAVNLVSPLAQERRVAIALDLGKPPLWARADEQRLKQIVLNLLSNAVKYNHEGGCVDVRIRATQDGRVQLSVTDSGHGIASEDLPRLFRPFERLGAECGPVPGTGLGLSLSRGLADAMAGELAADSELGFGSTFTLTLDAADPAPRPEPTRQLPAPTVAPAPLHDHTVLCIEDNVANLTLIEEVFAARPGVRLLTAVQGSMGLELAHQHAPDLVLLDLNLPDGHGREILRALSETPETSETPVVIVSADANPARIDELLVAGATAYLTKPIDVCELLAAVDHALAGEPVSV